MEDLLIATREAVHFAVHDGLEVLYVEKIVSHRGEAIRSRVAGRLPLHCTATGKVMLAFSPTTLLKDVVDEGLTALTRHTIMSPALLGKQLMKVRSEGLAVEVEEARVGYMSMAVPVFSGHSTLVGALSVTGPTARLNAHRLSPALRTAGHGIERTLQAMDRTQNQLKQNVRLPVCEPGHADASSVANSRRVH
jgi:DNA-binding IclR family transcriptional regulator